MASLVVRSRLTNQSRHRAWIDDCVAHARKPTLARGQTRPALSRCRTHEPRSPLATERHDYTRSQSMPSDRFEKAAKNMFKLDKAHKIYSLAAFHTAGGEATSALMWKCALLHYMNDNVKAFKRRFLAMLQSTFLVEPMAENANVWQHAIRLGLEDDTFLQEMYAICCNRQLAEGVWPKFYTMWQTAIIAHQKDAAVPVFLWHRRFQRDGLGLGHIDWSRLCRGICSSDSPSKLLFGLHGLMRQTFQAPRFYDPVIDHLVQNRRFEEAQQCHLYFHRFADLPSSSAVCDPLLSFHLRHSTRSVTLSFIEQLEQLPTGLASSTKNIIAGFHASSQDYAQLKATANEDAYWAAALLAAAKTGHRLDPILKQMREQGCPLGPASLQACMDSARDLETVKTLITGMMQQGYRISARGYAVLVRYIAKQGDGQKAYKIVRACLERDAELSDVEAVSQADTEYLYRNLILGLLEGRHFTQLEARHHELISGGQATSDTWNLLIRSRIVNAHMDDALAGLEEMAIQNLVVENATAEEFSVGLLRRRRVGRNPDVMDLEDRRPYLVDIKLAIQAVSKCMRHGGRVQPEAWREICKRLSLYGEFKTLDTVMSWLLHQYNPVPDPQRKQHVQFTRTVRQLSLEHPNHPLQRLLTPYDVGSIVTRGFMTGKPVEAVTMLVKWSAWTLIDPVIILRRIKVGVRAMASKPRAQMSEVRQIQDKTVALAESLPSLQEQIKRFEQLRFADSIEQEL